MGSGRIQGMPSALKLSILPLLIPCCLGPQSPLLQSGAGGEFMGNLSAVVQQLKKERARAQK
jgi:hypothetical protein